MKGTLPHAFCACLSIRSWLSAGPTSPGIRPYSFLCRNYSGPPPYAEATPQSKTPPSGLVGGDPARVVDRSSPFLALKTCLLNGYIGRVYLPLAVPRFRFTYVSLDLLSRSPPYSRPFLGPAQDCLMLLNREGFGRGFGSPSHSGHEL